MNLQRYLAGVRQHLYQHGYWDVHAPSDLAGDLPLVLTRDEGEDRLLVGVARPDMAPPDQEALMRAAGAWVRNLAAARGAPNTTLVLAFPFTRRVDDTTAATIRRRRENGPDGRWSLIPWVADLEVELVDRHAGPPLVGDEVARALTEVERSAPEQALRKATGPRTPVRSPFGGPFVVTRTILAVTVAYYLWSLLASGEFGINELLNGPSRGAMVLWGSNRTDLVLEHGQNWRLFTHMLLHFGLVHLLFNMLSLWNLGRHMEMIFGSRRTLFIYLFAGVMGGVASAMLRPEFVHSAGASGAIFGLMGAQVYAARVLSRGTRTWRELLSPLLWYVVLGLFLPLDNWAHGGGFAGGIAAAFVAGLPGKRTAWRRAGIAGLSALAALIASGFVRLPHLF